MMNGFSSGIAIGGWMWLIHVLFNLVFVVGLALFLVWLVQFLNKKDQLLTWSIILLIVGTLGALSTFQWNITSMMGFNNWGFQGMYQHMLDEDHEEISSHEEFREHMIEEMSEYMGAQ